MKLKNILFATTLGVTALSSCSDKMDYKEYNGYDAEYIQKMFSRVGGLMTYIYSDFDNDWGNYGGAVLGSATDESVYSHPGAAIEDFYNGSWSPTNAYQSVWNTAWNGISYCNLVLDKFMGLTFPEYTLDVHYKEEMAQYKNYEYEARFARAYFYFELVRQYKNVPLKLHDMTADEANKLPQSSSDEVFKFIDDECAEIQDKIVKDYTAVGYPSVAETGRAGKLAVMALRARAALYHASPLFNTNNDKTLWFTAAKLCQDVLDEAQNEGKSLARDYSKLFLADGMKDVDTQKEFIFGSRSTTARNTFEKYNFPIGMENAGGGNCPTQNLVDAFEMSNGKAINEEGSGYDPQNPYSNRDKRLSWIVACNGEQWPNSIKSPLETYVGGANSSSVTYGTPTSYYLKKYVNPTLVIGNTNPGTAAHIWVIFRLAEYYLDYAEAVMNFTGDGYTKPQGLKYTAAQAINVVRKRAGQPDMETGLAFDQFKKKYENERFVELAFEGHRFFDLRRWKNAPEYLTTIRKMTITKADDGTLTFTPGVLETRTWENKWYLFPFPQKDVLNCGYTQNEGW